MTKVWLVTSDESGLYQEGIVLGVYSTYETAMDVARKHMQSYLSMDNVSLVASDYTKLTIRNRKYWVSPWTVDAVDEDVDISFEAARNDGRTRMCSKCDKEFIVTARNLMESAIHV